MPVFHGVCRDLGVHITAIVPKSRKFLRLYVQRHAGPDDSFGLAAHVHVGLYRSPKFGDATGDRYAFAAPGGGIATLVLAEKGGELEARVRRAGRSHAAPDLRVRLAAVPADCADPWRPVNAIIVENTFQDEVWAAPVSTDRRGSWGAWLSRHLRERGVVAAAASGAAAILRAARAARQ